jgi:acetyl-CoA acyltransferase
MGRKAYVVGVGMTRFERPGTRDWDYPDMVAEAGSAALRDAGIDFAEVQQVIAGYVFGDSCAGQRAVSELGLTGVPVHNVNNNCATGSSALVLARQAVEGGLADVAMAVGFERMQRGAIAATYADRAMPLERHLATIAAGHPPEPTPMAPQTFGMAGREHMERYGSTAEDFARVAEKNHRHSADNPHAQFRDVYTLQEVLASPVVHAPLTRLQCSPTSDGAAAAVLMSADAVDRAGRWDQAVEITAQSMVTDLPTSFVAGSAIAAVGSDMTRRAARAVYEQSGLGPEDVDVIELHDCFSVNEVLTYEALGLAREGQGHRLAAEGATTYGGDVVVNPSGGLISKGHPLGATGLAQCSELVWQLRGEAGPRQVLDARVALQHNLGLGGAAVVTMYTRASGTAAPGRRSGDGR